MFTASVEGAVELATAWVGVRASVRAGMRHGVTMGVKEGAAEARAKHRFKNKTGRLEHSIQGHLTGSSDTEQRGEIVATMKYASFVEEGTKAHVILAREGGMLRFVIGGRTIFSRKVNHPGSAPHPFMSFAYFKCEAVMLREIEIGIADAQRILDR
jgi:hypothetical protein